MYIYCFIASSECNFILKFDGYIYGYKVTLFLLREEETWVKTQSGLKNAHNSLFLRKPPRSIAREP